MWNIINEEAISIDMGNAGMGDLGMDGGMYEEIPVDPMNGAKDPIMSNAVFVFGLSAATLAISVVIGVLLAKRKIKKGFELYED